MFLNFSRSLKTISISRRFSFFSTPWVAKKEKFFFISSNTIIAPFDAIIVPNVNLSISELTLLALSAPISTSPNSSKDER